jgi:cell division protein FtsQ
MSRSIAASPGRRRIGAPAKRPAARGSARSGLGITRPFDAAAGAIRGAFALMWRRRWSRIALISALIAIPVLGGVWLWVRQSPFVAVKQVQIYGVHGTDAPEVEAALTSAAHGMSTLDVSDSALLAAVAQLHVVSAVRAVPRFPHGLRIEVTEQLPVASLDFDGIRTAVAADGVVLGPTLLSGSLPTVDAYRIPATGQRVSGPNVLRYLAVLGAAPSPFVKFIERVYTGPKGLTVAMRNGLLIYFGDVSRPHAKWLSFARVLADSSSAGASYVDVRLPGRPAAGFPSGVTPPDASTEATGAAGSSEQVGATPESTIASLAAALASGSGVGNATSEPGSTASGASSPSSSTEPESGASTSGTTPEASTGASAETGSAAPSESAQAATTPGG